MSNNFIHTYTDDPDNGLIDFDSDTGAVRISEPLSPLWSTNFILVNGERIKVTPCGNMDVWRVSDE